MWSPLLVEKAINDNLGRLSGRVKYLIIHLRMYDISSPQYYFELRGQKYGIFSLS